MGGISKALSSLENLGMILEILSSRQLRPRPIDYYRFNLNWNTAEIEHDLNILPAAWDEVHGAEYAQSGSSQWTIPETRYRLIKNTAKPLISRSCSELESQDSWES